MADTSSFIHAKRQESANPNLRFVSLHRQAALLASAIDYLLDVWEFSPSTELLDLVCDCPGRSESLDHALGAAVMTVALEKHGSDLYARLFNNDLRFLDE